MPSFVEQRPRQPIQIPGGTPPYVPETPGGDIAQGAPKDIGSLTPIIAYLMKLLGGGQQTQPPVPSPWAPGGAPTDPGGSAMRKQSGNLDDLRSLMTNPLKPPQSSLPSGFPFPQPVPPDIVNPANPSGISDADFQRLQELHRRQIELERGSRGMGY